MRLPFPFKFPDDICPLQACVPCKPELVPKLGKVQSALPELAWLLCSFLAWPDLRSVSPPPHPLCRARSVLPLRCHRYWIKQVCYCRQTPGSILAWSCVWIGVSRALSGATPSDTAGARSNFDFHSSPRACRTP